MWRFLRKFIKFAAPETSAQEPDREAETGADFFQDPFDGLAIQIPIEDHIDLHTFDPGETREILEAYLSEAAEHGFSRVRIVHGKGSGVQRRIVRSFLSRHFIVTEFHDAPPEEGGWGATVAHLEVPNRKDVE